jgi:hypothetical protein
VLILPFVYSPVLDWAKKKEKEKPMKFHFLFVSLFCVFLSGCNLTGDSGLWRGSVSTKESYDRSEQCDLEIEITRSSDTLIVHSLNLNCPRYSYQWRVGAFDLFGGGIWKHGQRVGNVDPSGEVELELFPWVTDEPLPMGNRSIKLRWNRLGSELQFWQESNRFGWNQITSGWLRKVR